MTPAPDARSDSSEEGEVASSQDTEMPTEENFGFGSFSHPDVQELSDIQEPGRFAAVLTWLYLCSIAPDEYPGYEEACRTRPKKELSAVTAENSNQVLFPLLAWQYAYIRPIAEVVTSPAPDDWWKPSEGM